MPISRAMARRVTPAVPSAAICALATALISSTVAWRTRSRRDNRVAVSVMLTAYGIVNTINNSEASSGEEISCARAGTTCTWWSGPAAPPAAPWSASWAAAGTGSGAAAGPGTATAPPGVERLPADVATPDGAKAAAAGAAVVYHCAQPPYTDWPAAFPPLPEAIAEGAAAAGAKLVLADTLYLYGPHDGPLTEDLPAAATGPKGRTRARMAERLLVLHGQGRLRVAIGLASHHYGPGGLCSVSGGGP